MFADTDVRLYVVNSPMWNASAAANGSIWIHTGLLRDAKSDDEVAAVLGHELAHYTHEHLRKNHRQTHWQRLVYVGASAAIAEIDSPWTQRDVTRFLELSLAAWYNGYGRNLEDQADRVGLRYAHEAGFDVSHAIQLWQRRLNQRGESSRVTNFFWEDHSRPSDRIRNIEQQIALNYR